MKGKQTPNTGNKHICTTACKGVSQVGSTQDTELDLLMYTYSRDEMASLQDCYTKYHANKHGDRTGLEQNCLYALSENAAQSLVLDCRMDLVGSKAFMPGDLAGCSAHTSGAQVLHMHISVLAFAGYMR